MDKNIILAELMQRCRACGADCPEKATKCWMCHRPLDAGELSSHDDSTSKFNRKSAQRRTGWGVGEISYALVCALVTIVGIGLACENWEYMLLYVPVVTSVLMICSGIFHRWIAIGFGMVLATLVAFSLFIAFLISCLNNPIRFGGP